MRRALREGIDGAPSQVAGRRPFSSAPRRVTTLVRAAAARFVGSGGVVVAVAALTVPGPPAAAPPPESSTPWLQVLDPAEAGWSPEALETARQHALAAGTTAFILVQDGVVVTAWGAVDLPLKTHSIRKSLYSVTFGPFVESGEIDLGATLADLGIDDLAGLTADEKKATVNDLLASRSGVYHPAAYETESAAATRPERGSADPGTNWYYNNWDFNVLPAIFAAQTGRSIEAAFVERIARPLGMEDFEPQRDTFAWLEPTVSRYPAVTFRMSARDLARIGQLLVDDGDWGGAQVISQRWVDESTKPRTIFPPEHQRGEGNGYAYLWWTMPAHPEDPSPWRRFDRIAALGAGGHCLFVIPSLDLVLVHRTNTESGRGLSDRDAIAVLEEVLAARVGVPQPTLRLGPLRPAPLSEPPHVDARLARPIPPAAGTALVGTYRTDEGAHFVIFEHEARIFVRREASFASEAEIFADGPGHYFSPLAPLHVETLAERGGEVASIAVSLFGRTATAHRTD